MQSIYHPPAWELIFSYQEITIDNGPLLITEIIR